MLLATAHAVTSVHAADPFTRFFLQQSKYTWNGVAVSEAEVFVPTVSEDGTFTIPVAATKDAKLPWTFEGNFSPEPIELGKVRGLSFTGPDAKSQGLASPSNGVGVANSFYFPLTGKMKTLTFQIAGTNSFSGAYAELLIDGKSMFRQSSESIAKLTTISWDVSKYADEKITKLARLRLVDRDPVSIIAVGNVQSTVVFTPASAEKRDRLLLEFRRLVEDYRVKHRLPSIYAGIWSHGTGSLSVATGNRALESDVSTQLSDVLRIGSVSKAITATWVATEVDRGVITWRTTVGEVFPRLKAKYGDHPLLKASVLDLLLHRSGVNRQGLMYAQLSKLDGRTWRYRYVEECLSHESVVSVGSQYIYGPGFQIVAAMIEQLTGESYEQLIKRDLFDKLGVTSFVMGDPAAQGLNCPTQYWVGPDGSLKPAPICNEYIRNDPAGGVCMMINDILSVAALHLNGKWNGKDVISGASISTLHTPLFGDGVAPSFYISRDATGDWLEHAGATGCGDRSQLSVNLAKGLVCFFNVPVNYSGDSKEQREYKDCTELLRRFATKL